MSQGGEVEKQKEVYESAWREKKTKGERESKDKYERVVSESGSKRGSRRNGLGRRIHEYTQSKVSCETGESYKGEE